MKRLQKTMNCQKTTKKTIFAQRLQTFSYYFIAAAATAGKNKKKNPRQKLQFSKKGENGFFSYSFFLRSNSLEKCMCVSVWD